MLVHTPHDGDHSFDFRETAPGAAHQDMFESNPNDAKLGARAVAVPGEIRGFAMAHARFGRLPWASLFAPNIKLAREGFTVTKKLSSTITKFRETLYHSPAMRKTYFRPDGTPKQPGDRVERPELAKTLESIAADPKRDDVFYNGAIADSLVDFIQRSGGIITKDDFVKYEAIHSEALKSTYRDYEVLTTGIPSAGPVLIEALNILSKYDMQNLPAGDRIHILVEAMKFAYGSRMRLGDPRFEDMEDELRRMLSTKNADKLASKIDRNHTHRPDYYTDVIQPINDRGTTHVSVIDADGMGVSSTCTVNLEFGAKLMDPVTGIILNNEMDDFSIPGHQNQFSLPPSPINFIKPGKRPMSSSTPAILLRNGQIQVIVGGTGGSRIISSTLSALVQMIDLGASAIEAVNAPRLHHQLIPNYLIAEHDVPEPIVRDLEGRGHTLHVLKEGYYFSSVQAIKRNPFTGGLVAAADGRKGGGVDGY